MSVTSIHPSPPNVPPNVQSSLRGLLRCWNTCLSAPVVEGDGAPRPAETCSNNAQPSATVRQIYNNHIGPNYAGVSEQGGPGGGAPPPHVRGGGAEYHFPPPPNKFRGPIGPLGLVFFSSKLPRPSGGGAIYEIYIFLWHPGGVTDPAWIRS